ncbi:hypothetical protein [Leptothrix discophora]|uniref:Uncharacterized protein n=1 Tax=Leptothrix discophora TaxID=89 RepID=A0ABT9G661_LEPDI|nr:hypothetical protein [Leptothrix discophora]MDP4301970.1 hypothetical protein [Leptothrix discophora]
MQASARVTHRRRQPEGWWALLAGALLAGTAQAQSIDIASARARVGAPIELVLRVRATDLEPGTSLQRCVQATVFHGNESGSVTTLRTGTVNWASDGEIRVTLSDDEPVREPVVRIRAALVCGARYTREFTLLVDPPLETAAVQPLSGRDGDAGIAAIQIEPGVSAEVGTGATAQPGNGTATLRALPPRTRADRSNRAAAASASASAPVRAVRAAEAPAPAAAAVAPSVTSTQAAAEMTAAVERLYQQIESMRDEQRQSQEALTALRARLDQTEHERDQAGDSAGTLRTALYVALGVLGVLLLPRLLGFGWILTRYLINQRRRRGTATPVGRDTTFELMEDDAQADAVVAPSRWAVSVAPSAWGRDAYSSRDVLHADPGPERGWNRDVPAPPPKVSTRTYVPVPQVLPDESTEFDPEGLDDSRHALLLEKIDAIAAEGAPGASATLLEGALKGRIGRSPGIYLRLLDHYRQLGQPANVERVLGELCGHYNVRADLSAADGHEGAPLEEHPDIWPAIRDAWHAHGVAALLAAVIRRPSFHTPLSLAAFREAVWLYAVARLRDEPVGRGGSGGGVAQHEPLQRVEQSVDVVS